MPLYGGIDLHANNSVVVLLNEQDQRIYHKRVAERSRHDRGAMEPLIQADIEGLVVESTYNWYWLVDGFMDAGYRLPGQSRGDSTV